MIPLSPPFSFNTNSLNMHPETPLLLQATFPAIIDSDVEESWDHIFCVNKCIAYKGILSIYATLDNTIPLRLEYDTQLRILKLVHTHIDVDVVSPAIYNKLRPSFEYEDGPHKDEAYLVGTTGADGADACFLPTFGCGGPWIPYILQNVLISTKDVRVLLPSVTHL